MTKNITDFVQSCIDDYKHFVDIDSFPSFDVKPKEMTLEKSLKQGFDAPAAAFYDIPTGNHTLEIWSKLSIPQMNAAGKVSLLDALYGKMIVSLAQRNKLA